MRLWTLHPKYLDRQGLLGLWREALLAQAVLSGVTRGYKNHPQLERFKKHPHPRQAIAYSWASRVISISLEMVLPGLLGVWLDRKLGTRVLLTVLGFGLGLTLGMMHLLRIARMK